MLRREPRIDVWSTDTTPSRPDTEPWISELLPDPATPVTTTSTPRGMSTSTFFRLCVLALRTFSASDEVRTAGGEVVFEGTVESLTASDTLTGRHLSDRASLKPSVRKAAGVMKVRGARAHNLKNVDVDIPEMGAVAYPDFVLKADAMGMD